MSRPHNLDKLAEREERARLKEEEYRLRRIRESKAFHRAQGKEHQKRLIALGQLVEEQFPDKSVTEIAILLHAIRGSTNGQGAPAPTRHKKEAVKDASDAIVPPETRDEAMEVIE